MVDVRLSSSPEILIEEEETEAIIRFELSEPPPPEGLRVPVDVSIDSDAPKPLAQFDLQGGIEQSGLEIEELENPFQFAEGPLNRFTPIITSQQASLELGVNNDEFDEGRDVLTLSLSDTPEFDIVPDGESTTFTIFDERDQVPDSELPIEEEERISFAQDEKTLNITAPPNEDSTIRHEVVTRDGSNEVFEIGYTILESDQPLPETNQEKLEAVNNGASLFSVYPNTFENGEPGQFDFFNFGFENADNSLERFISLPNDTRIAYYLMEGKEVTSDNVSSSNIEQVTFDAFEISENNNRFTLDGDNVTFTAESTDRSVPQGSNLQASEGLEVFDLTQVTETVTATLGFDLISEAEFDNVIGFYTVEDATGSIETGNEVIAPSDTDYTEAALANSRQNFGGDALLNRDAAQGDQFTVEGGEIMVPFILAQAGDIEEIPSKLPEDVQVYFPFIGANSDGADHFRILADNTFGIEDRQGGGDQDFNDVIFQLDFG